MTQRCKQDWGDFPVSGGVQVLSDKQRRCYKVMSRLHSGLQISAVIQNRWTGDEKIITWLWKIL